MLINRSGMHGAVCRHLTNISSLPLYSVLLETFSLKIKIILTKESTILCSFFCSTSSLSHSLSLFFKEEFKSHSHPVSINYS